ncbi:hypothetical protein [Eudoraea chungangensis]|uniref:hypothetical protein n=1 Tax=Eudoraea chungangensis TaxID=1481905 RepID=UPI0023EA9D1D|nr:hypothetical protein [Eudoraea chungangensis]
MQKSLLSFLSFLFISISLNAQSTAPGSVRAQGNPLDRDMALRWLNNADNMNRARRSKLDLSTIEGSVYYNENFIKGDVFYLTKLFDSYPMRYNAFSDEIEIQRTEGSPLESVYKSTSLTCIIDNESYVYSKYFDSKGEIKEGYIIRLNEGSKYVLFEKKTKVYKEGRKGATSMHPTYPPKFEDKHDYFISADGEVPVQFKGSKKELTAIFGNEKASELKSFIKKNKIKLNKEEDLVKLMEFVNDNA